MLLESMNLQGLILIVDDEPANLNVLSEVLIAEGYDLAIANSGERAITIVNRQLPDLILLDIHMPDMDGFTVCQKLKKDQKTSAIPVIFMTALNDIESKVKGFEMGAVDYITKPFNVRELLARIKNHLQLTKVTQNLEKVKEQLSLVLKGSNDGWWDLDLLQNQAYNSTRWWDMLGYIDGEIESSFENWQKLIHPDDRDRVNAKMITTESNNQQHLLEFEYRLLHKQGHYVPIYARALLQRDDTGKAIRISGTNSDLTAWKQKESELQQALKTVHELNLELENRVAERTQTLQRLIAAIEASIDGIAVVNEDGKYIYINAAHLELFGYQHPSELIGETWKVFYYPDEVQRIEQEVFPIIGETQKWRGEAIAKRRDGSTFVEELSLTMVQGVGLICVCRDGTERKEMENGIRQSLAKEKELSQLRSNFISTASHEFRTPLTIISSSSSILENYSDRLTEDKKNNHLQRIQSSVSHMVNLLDDVLTVNRAEVNKLDFNPEIVELVAFCQNISEEIQLSTKEHSISFFAVPNNLDDTDLTTLNIRCDVKLMRQIITNLLSNAIKYTPDGGMIYLWLMQQHNNAVLKVQDHGIGIPIDDQTKLFDSFYRARNVGNISGTGLGLAIVKKCVDLHNGVIGVESAINEGTTFTVIIPKSPNIPNSPKLVHEMLIN
ncbi:response regulator [Pseudanabaena sp. ABRG5-3]|uniref:response regulator n=1 Tax=Pseudanabaena sp. ABRG5-3 TaxID=685565 RepID=UPI000DC6F131|nr:response regulator [Pseudanabaena sp. ABRG5-3]BBC23198.1 multi-sensor hybrid histidine kinase [Pseudanabaena sp. ABRG5-3]